MAEPRELRDRREKNVDSAGRTMVAIKATDDGNETVSAVLNTEWSNLAGVSHVKGQLARKFMSE
jgi:hypothetical protein